MLKFKVSGLVLSALSLLLALAGHLAQAGDAISSDRPDIADSPDVVGRGRLQLELGLAGDTSKIEGQRLRSLSTPFLLRFGLSEDWELRLDGDGRQSSHASNAPGATGWGDLGLGAKWHLNDGNGDGEGSKGMPALGLLGHLTFATGSGGFRGRGTRPELDLALGWELPQGFDLSVMPGLYRDRNDAGQSYTGGVLAVSLGKSFSERLQGFIELAGQKLAASKNGGKVLTLATGLTYQLTPDLQLDAAVFRGLNKQSPDWQWTTGLSTRF